MIIKNIINNLKPCKFINIERVTKVRIANLFMIKITFKFLTTIYNILQAITSLIAS